MTQAQAEAITGRLRRPLPRIGALSATIAARLPQGSDALLLVAVLSLAIALLALAPSAFGVDTWLALVVGREIWQAGLPQHNTLTVMSAGARWVDQQWLAQLASYALYRLGGLGLLGALDVGAMAAAVWAALRAARARGARASIVMVTLALCMFEVVPSREVRTQAFAIPLIAALILLLSADSRRPSARVYWSLPLLAIWANLHGTASLGAGLVCLRAGCIAWERWGAGERSWRGFARPLALGLGAPAMLAITPYGLAILAYYHSTLFDGQLRRAVTEWQPITSSPAMAAAFFALAGAMLWSFGRAPRATSTWEKLALLALAAGSIDVIRTALLFGLAALAILPASFDAALPRRPARAAAPVRQRLNLLLCTAVIAALCALTAWTLGRSPAAFQRQSDPPGVLAAVRGAVHRDPALRVFADTTSADWLLWRDPALAGHVAYDARLELLDRAQITSILEVLGAVGPGWSQGADGYRLIVLPSSAAGALQGFLKEPGARELYAGLGHVVILRSAAGAGH